MPNAPRQKSYVRGGVGSGGEGKQGLQKGTCPAKEAWGGVQQDRRRCQGEFGAIAVAAG